jgi:Lrp/AsnC family transcriptional regulator for asnA, asnC and gidA
MTATRGTQIDDLDFAILRLLAKDGRMSFAEMGRILGVPLGTARNRFLRLKERMILHVIGWIDPRELGYQASANILIRTQSKSIESVRQQLETLPEVEFLARVTGEYDLVADIVCKDLEDLNEFLTQKLQPIQGVEDARVLLYHKYHKPVSAPPMSSVRRLKHLREFTIEAES